MPHPPNPFDPVEEKKVPQEKPDQTSTTPDTVPTPDYGDVANSVKDEEPKPPLFNDVVQEALESFKKLNRGEPAPHVEVEIDGEHISARWVKPKKYF